MDIGINDGDDSAIFEVFFAVDDLDERWPGSTSSAAADHAIDDGGGFGRWIESADDQGARSDCATPPA